MQFMTVARRRTEAFSDDAFNALVDAEVQQARTLYAEGFIRQLWHRGDVRGVCILVEAQSEDEVRERLNTLPLYAAGMIEFSVIPLKPWAGFGPRAS
jgi:muconolactone delta-isomerase